MSLKEVNNIEKKMTQKKFSCKYKWIILALCFLMVFVCLGFCSSTKGLYLDVITKAWNIPRTQFAFNDSCRFISSAIINLFFGSLVYKYGVRKMTAFGFLMLIASMLTYAFAPNVFVFCIGGVLLGIGLTFTTTTMASSIIRRWFRKDIGKYSGIVFAANGVGGAVATQIISPMLNKSLFGYKTSYIFVAILLLVVGTIMVIFLRERPKDDTIEPTPAGKKKARGSTWSGIDYQTAKKRPYFYLTLIVVFLTGFSLQGIGGVYKAHMGDMGLNATLITNIVSIHSLALTATKILVGAIYDRFNLRKVMIVCQSSAILAFLILAFIAPTTTGAVLGFVFAFAFPLALPLETLVIPLIANDLFGNANYDKILGILIAANYSGYALGAPIVNLSFDFLGTYTPMLVVLAGVMLASCIVFQFVINKAWKEKKAIIAATKNTAETA